MDANLIPVLLTEKEAARSLGLSRSTLRQYRRQGHISFFKIGRHVRYSVEGLRAFLARCQRGEETDRG
jgi:excisionase family DNA binding protein